MKNPFAWIADLIRPPVADSVIPVGWTVHPVVFAGIGPGHVWCSPNQKFSFICWRTTSAWRRLQPSFN